MTATDLGQNSILDVLCRCVIKKERVSHWTNAIVGIRGDQNILQCLILRLPAPLSKRGKVKLPSESRQACQGALWVCVCAREKELDEVIVLPSAETRKLHRICFVLFCFIPAIRNINFIKVGTVVSLNNRVKKGPQAFTNHFLCECCIMVLPF